MSSSIYNSTTRNHNEPNGRFFFSRSKTRNLEVDDAVSAPIPALQVPMPAAPVFGFYEMSLIADKFQGIATIVATWIAQIKIDLFTEPVMAKVDELQVLISRKSSLLSSLVSTIQYCEPPDLVEMLRRANEAYDTVLVAYNQVKDAHDPMIDNFILHFTAPVETVDESPPKKKNNRVMFLQELVSQGSCLSTAETYNAQETEAMQHSADEDMATFLDESQPQQ